MATIDVQQFKLSRYLNGSLDSILRITSDQLAVFEKAVAEIFYFLDLTLEFKWIDPYALWLSLSGASGAGGFEA